MTGFQSFALSRARNGSRWWPLCTPGMAGSCAVRRIAPCSHAAQLPRPSGLFRTRGTVPPPACDQAIRFQAIYASISTDWRLCAVFSIAPRAMACSVIRCRGDGLSKRALRTSGTCCACPPGARSAPPALVRVSAPGPSPCSWPRRGTTAPFAARASVTTCRGQARLSAGHGGRRTAGPPGSCSDPVPGPIRGERQRSRAC